MVRVSGGTFRMGSDKHYPEEAPVASRHRRRFLDRPHAGHQPAIQGIREGDRPRHLRGDRARSEGLSRRAAAHALCRLAGVHAAGASGRSAQLEPVVEFPEGRRLAPSLWPEEQHQRPRQSSGRACRLFATRSLTRNGRARICRPKRNGNSPRAADSTARNSRGAMNSRPAAQHRANTWQGEFPARESQRRRFRAHVAGDGVSAERLRHPRHDRECLGMDERLVFAKARGRCAEGLLHSGKSARRARGGELRSLPAADQNSAQGFERRLASVRAELLPALSPGRASCGAGRYVDQSRRISMRQARSLWRTQLGA